MAVETHNSRLQIPHARSTRAFLEIARNVRKSPILGDRIKTWVIPGMEEESLGALDPKTLITDTMCPVLMMWPEPREGQPQTNVSQQATLNVVIEVYVLGINPLDAMDLYEPVMTAVSPKTTVEGQTLRERLQPITEWSGQLDIDQPGVVRLGQDGPPITMARGSVSTKYKIPSH